MRVGPWLGVAVFVLVGCAGGEQDAADANAVEADEPADAGALADADEPAEAEEPNESDIDDQDDEPAEEPVDDLAPPPSVVTEPVGVVYETTGSLTQTFGLIQTPDVSVFSTEDVTSYTDAEFITVCPTGEGCTRMGREAMEGMGLLGGEIVADATAFATSVPFASSSTATIAGRDARCIVPVDAEQLRSYCYDLISGIALSWEVVDEDIPTTVTAIEVFEPSADDLEPSGPVEDAGAPA